MMILFAIIGVTIEADIWYWLTFGLMSAVRLAKAVWEVANDA